MRSWRLALFRIFVAMFLGLLAPSTLLKASLPEKPLLDANATRFKQMLDRLQNETGGDPLQKSLQQALLQRLILLEEKPPRSTPLFEALLKKQPTDIPGYRLLFRDILDAAVTLESLRKELAKQSQELKTLKKELVGARSRKRDLYTLQLQYLYTYKKRKQISQELQKLETLFKKFPDHFLQILPKLRYEASPLRRDLLDTQEKLRGLERSAEDLTLEKERLTLLGNQKDQIRQLEQGLQSIAQARKELLGRQIQDLTLLYAIALKNRDKEAFELTKEIQKTLEELGLAPETVSQISDLLLSMSQKRFGLATTLGSAAGQELSRTVHLFWKHLNAPLFTLNQTPISAFKIVVALIIFVLGIFVGLLYKRTVQGFSAHNITEATRTLLSNMGYYLIVIIAFFLALHSLGINLSSIALVAGALSVGIGFGLQNIVSNFISGIILMFERSIKIGDYIELSDTLRGRVTDIRMRSITITTNANIDIIVPNQELIQNRVINWTMNDKIRRFEIPFGVAYGSDPAQVISVVMQAVGKSGFEDIYTSRERQTQVIMTGMGDSSVDFTLFVWIKGAKTLWPKRTTSRFLILIYNALNEAGISIPFPQRDLHLRSVDAPIPVRIERDDASATVSEEPIPPTNETP